MSMSIVHVAIRLDLTICGSLCMMVGSVGRHDGGRGKAEVFRQVAKWAKWGKVAEEADGCG